MKNFKLILLLAIVLVTTNACIKKEIINPTTTIEVKVPKLQLVVLTTDVVSNITETSAILGGNVTSDSATVTARGICYSSSNKLPTLADSKTSDGVGVGSFVSSLSGLTAGTSYFARAYVTISAGTGYGNVVSFSTKQPIPTTITDVDGNTYNTVTIGGQTWMKENLRTTKYNDGSSITFPNTNNPAWQSNVNGAYSWYSNNTLYKNDYGALYNWYAASNANLAPKGWHVATDADWNVLADNYGGETLAGGKLKEAGTSHWKAPNTGATNASLFTALPGGSRDLSGTYDTFGFNGNFWTASSSNVNDAWSRYVYYGNTFIYRYAYNKHFGYSVRCVLN